MVPIQSFVDWIFLKRAVEYPFIVEWAFISEMEVCLLLLVSSPWQHLFQCGWVFIFMTSHVYVVNSYCKSLGAQGCCPPSRRWGVVLQSNVILSRTESMCFGRPPEENPHSASGLMEGNRSVCAGSPFIWGLEEGYRDPLARHRRRFPAEMLAWVGRLLSVPAFSDIPKGGGACTAFPHKFAAPKKDKEENPWGKLWDTGGVIKHEIPPCSLWRIRCTTQILSIAANVYKVLYWLRVRWEKPLQPASNIRPWRITNAGIPYIQ